MSTHNIGRDASGNAVYVTINLTERAGTFKTINHETVETITRVSVSGGIRDGRRQDYSACGQIVEDVAAVWDLAPGWTADDLASLVSVWRRWHLNDMRAGCSHVPAPVWEHGPYGRQPDLKNTPACHETGYRYGHAWLVEEVPADVVAELARLTALPTGRVPDWAI